MDLIELIELRKQKATELSGLVATAKTEVRKLNDVENEQFETIKKEITDIDAQIENREINVNKNKNNMENRFSLLKAIEARANGRSLDEVSQAVINSGRDESKRSGVQTSGDIVLPLEYRAAGDTIVAGTQYAGQEVVAEQKLNILAPLRNQMVLVNAGANMLTGLVGDVSIPTYSGTQTTWKGEVVAANSGSGTFAEVTLSPKRLTTYIDISKQFLAQDSVAAEQMLLNDIVNAIGEKLESTILGKEAGSATQPAGLFYSAPAISGSASWANIVAMETAVDTSNANIGNLKYITNAGGKGVLKTTVKATNTGDFLMDGTEVNGYPILTSNAVAKQLQTGANEFGIVYGNWNDLVIGQWGALDLVVDPYTVATEGKVRIVINSYWDAKPRRDASFKTASVK